MKGFAQRWRCPVAFGLLGLIILLFLGGLILPVWWQHRIYNEALTDAQDQVTRYQRTIAKKPILIKQLNQLKKRQSQQSLHYEQATPALVAAKLQELVKRKVESNDGKLVSTQILTTDSSSEFPKVTIKVQMKGKIESIQQIFYALESSQPLLFIENVYMRAQIRHYRIRRRNRKAKPQGLLDVRFNLSAYMKENK